MTTPKPESVALEVGCPSCGASSNEPCWSDREARERSPHRARMVFADLLTSPEGKNSND